MQLSKTAKLMLTNCDPHYIIYFVLYGIMVLYKQSFEVLSWEFLNIPQTCKSGVLFMYVSDC